MGTSVLIDLGVLAILFFCTLQGYRNGFLKSVIRFVGYICAMVISFVGSRMLAALLSGMSRSYFLSFVTDKLGDITDSSPEEAVERMYDSMPEYLLNAAEFLFGSSEKLTQKVAASTQSAAEAITDAILLPIVTMLLQAVLFLILLGICLFLVRRLARAAWIVRKIPIIGSVNALFGGILGCLQGFLLLAVLIGIVSFLAAVSGGNETWLSEEVIRHTYLFRYLYDINPLTFR
jgi:uncharacterized membrane protein required for colicin V production